MTLTPFRINTGEKTGVGAKLLLTRHFRTNVYLERPSGPRDVSESLQIRPLSKCPYVPYFLYLPSPQGYSEGP